MDFLSTSVDLKSRSMVFPRSASALLHRKWSYLKKRSAVLTQKSSWSWLSFLSSPDMMDHQGKVGSWTVWPTVLLFCLVLLSGSVSWMYMYLCVYIDILKYSGGDTLKRKPCKILSVWFQFSVASSNDLLVDSLAVRIVSYILNS